MQRNIKKQRILLLISLCVSAQLFAGAPPIIPFEEGERFNLSLSKLNFNRVYVEGEKITQVSYPEGTFVVDKSELDVPESREGSVYLKPAFEAPLTVFFATDKGHHFSITVNADETYGKTLRLALRETTQRHYIRKDTSDVSLVDEVMESIKAGEIPKDFHRASVVSRPFYIKKDIKVSLEKEFIGKEYKAYVYRIENKAGHVIDLTPALFNNQKAESLSLSADTLNPKQIAYLYGLYPNEG